MSERERKKERERTKDGGEMVVSRNQEKWRTCHFVGNSERNSFSLELPFVLEERRRNKPKERKREEKEEGKKNKAFSTEWNLYFLSREQRTKKTFVVIWKLLFSVH